MAHGAGAVARIPPGVVVGAKAVLRAVHAEHEIRTVIVAADAPRDTTEPVRRLAAERSFRLVELPSSEELGRRCGIARPVAVAAEVGQDSVTKVPDLIPRSAQVLTSTADTTN